MDFEAVHGAPWAFPGMFSGVLGFKVTWSKWNQEPSACPLLPQRPPWAEWQVTRRVAVCGRWTRVRIPASLVPELPDKRAHP